MIENINTRILIVLISLLLCVIWVFPNFANLSEESWWFTKEKIVYGLDIQGGLHLVMHVDTDAVIEESTKRLSSTLEEYFNDEKFSVESINVVKAITGEMKIVFAAGVDRAAASAKMQEQYVRTLQVIEEEGQTLVVRYYEAELRLRRSKIVGQAIETIRNRIDEFGVSEPSITAQGTDRILVQLPGIKDANRAKDLINKTARLDFMIVHDDYDQAELAGWITEAEEKGGYKLGKGGLPYSKYVERLNKDLADKLPKDSTVYFEKLTNAKSLEVGSTPYLLRTDTNLGGDALKDAFVSQNSQYGSWEVALRFTAQGGKKFGDITGANVGKRMAVVLDKVVKTAPNLTERIATGEAVITLGTGNTQELLDEAQFISTALRAGSLPASLEQLEERTVGPSLGADSIARGKKAGIVGAILVLVFMLLYYKASGIVANLALVFNLLIVLAALTSLGATLTLPGVAGIVLTIGMAVDANVIIFERIKEELAKGAALALAIKEGYSRAFSAIFDANITTAAVCVVLMYFGTGPVRGFAVTLIIGIIASMFTAIFVTRTVFEVLMQKMKVQKISI